MSDDDESGMSNEVSAINGKSSLNSGIGSDTTGTDAGSSSGCFIATLN